MSVKDVDEADKGPGQNFESVELNTFVNSGAATDSRFISFHNITYTVEQRVCFKKQPAKIILNDVRYGVFLLFVML